MGNLSTEKRLENAHSQQRADRGRQVLERLFQKSLKHIIAKHLVTHGAVDQLREEAPATVAQGSSPEGLIQ